MSRVARVLAVAGIMLVAIASAADAAVPHTVAPGETLWSIAAANNLTTATVAAYNGLSEDANVYAGETIQVPTEAEGATALATGGASSTDTSPSAGGTSHVVQPGETLSSVAAANGISTAALASANGLSADAMLISGQAITIPAAGATATSAAATVPATSPSTWTAPSSPPAPEHPSWTAPIYCPSCPAGEAYLASNAASSWNAMRRAALSTYGIDLYPAGPLSAYRSYGQQLYLYDLYLSGQGSLAASPGTSSHEYGSALDLADPAMANVIDQIGGAYGWAKTEAPGEWWHVNYVGP